MGMLDKVFKKEQTEEELQTKEDLMMKSSEERYDEEKHPEYTVRQSNQGYSGTDRTLIQMEKDVELLKVQIELMKQSKIVSDERFTKFSEQMGEIRATVLDSERDTATIKMQAEKSIELIQMVQPEKLMNEVKKQDLKIEQMRGIEEKYSIVQQKMMDELKELRQRTEAIRGSETILKLNEQVQAELSTALQVQGKMEQKADKIEAIYAEFQQHFYEYQKVFDRMKDLDAEFKEVSKEFNIFKVKIEGAASKSDFLKLKNELKEYGSQLDSKIIEAEKAIAKADMAKADILKDLRTELEDDKKEILSKVLSATEAKEKIDSMRIELLADITSDNEDFKKAFDSKLSKLEESQKELAKAKKDIDSLMSDMGKMKELESDFSASEKTIAGLVKDVLAISPLKTQFDATSKELILLEKEVGAISEVKDEWAKGKKQLADQENELKELAQIKIDYEKRLNAIEKKSEELINKSNRKLDATVSDLADNTSVIRDLVKEIYSLKTHTTNMLTKNDQTNLQKAINEKLIAFDMSLLKIERHNSELEQSLRTIQKEMNQQQKEVQKQLEDRIKELLLRKDFQVDKDRKDIV